MANFQSMSHSSAPEEEQEMFFDSDRCSSAVSEASSWAEEGEGSRRGLLLLGRLSEALYSDVRAVGDLGLECEQWRQNFPHLRVEGRAVTLTVDDSQPRPDSPTAEEEEVFACHGTAPA